jgi:putative ABC transport system substrate-binding protein
MGHFRARPGHSAIVVAGSQCFGPVLDRRAFILVLANDLPALAVAQQAARLPRVGFLRLDRPPQAYLDALEQGLHERGYLPGKDLLIEYRFADGNADNLPQLAVDLIGSKVDVIVAVGAQSTRAVRNVTSTIPIVTIALADPVGDGFAVTLAHPGGNVTGTSAIGWELLRKRIALFKESFPKMSRIAMLLSARNLAWNIGTDATPSNNWKETSDAAMTMGVSLRAILVPGREELGAAFGAMTADGIDAVVVAQDPMFDSPPYRVVQLAARHGLPAIYGPRIHVDAGGLMSYGPNIRELYRQTASFVARILRGARPGDLPIEQPTKLELIINLKTAKELGLAIPQSLLLRADEVVQ